MDVTRGRTVDVTKYPPSRIRMRALAWDELKLVNDVLGTTLDAYGLRLKGVIKEALVAQATAPYAKVGFLQRELRIPLTLLHGLGGAAVHADGLSTGKTPVNKRRVDRGAAGLLGYGLHGILGNWDDRVAVVAAAEGERVKPGEAGGNPARFLSQVFGPEELRKNIASILEGTYPKDVQVVHVITDDVDGTGKATEGLHSSVTSGAYTQSPVRALPDEYICKVVSSARLPDNLTAASSPREIVEALSRAHQVPKSQLNLFALIRKRHDKPIAEAVELGANFIQDKDGDVMPAIAASIGRYLFENGFPLHGIAANVGGAAEAGLLIVVLWRGGSVLLQFASKKGLKSDNWDDRQKFSEGELSNIRSRGYDPYSPFKLEAVIDDPFADGVAAFGPVTDCLWLNPMPETGMGMLGVEFGIEGIRVHPLEVSANGRAEICHASFEYRRGEQDTRDLLVPYMTRLLSSQADQVEGRVREMLQSNELRLRTEFGQEYYAAMQVIEDRFSFDEATYASLRADGRNQRFTQADDAIIQALKGQRPEWFSELGA